MHKFEYKILKCKTKKQTDQIVCHFHACLCIYYRLVCIIILSFKIESGFFFSGILHTLHIMHAARTVTPIVNSEQVSKVSQLQIDTS